MCILSDNDIFSKYLKGEKSDDYFSIIPKIQYFRFILFQTLPKILNFYTARYPTNLYLPQIKLHYLLLEVKT